MKKTVVTLVVLGLSGHAFARPAPGHPAPGDQGSYAALVAFFTEWRQAQKPRVVAGVPDYTPAGIDALRERLAAMRARFSNLDQSGLTAAQRIDRQLIESEMNGLDFDLRVLRPWSRNPAFYAMAIASQSDTPLREGPTIEGADRAVAIHAAAAARPSRGARPKAAGDPDAARAGAGQSHRGRARPVARRHPHPPRAGRGAHRVRRSAAPAPPATAAGRRARPRGGGQPSARGSRPGSPPSGAAAGWVARATTGTCATCTGSPTPGRTSWC